MPTQCRRLHKKRNGFKACQWEWEYSACDTLKYLLLSWGPIILTLLSFSVKKVVPRSLSLLALHNTGSHSDTPHCQKGCQLQFSLWLCRCSPCHCWKIVLASARLHPNNLQKVVPQKAWLEEETIRWWVWLLHGFHPQSSCCNKLQRQAEGDRT